jgi:hypothetical protein
MCCGDTSETGFHIVEAEATKECLPRIAFFVRGRKARSGWLRLIIVIVDIAGV